MGSPNVSTSSSSPPPQFLNAYTNLINRAGGIANQPLQQYAGNTVAGLSQDQQAGIGQVQDATGIASPYINSAADYYGKSTTPITSSAPGVAAGASKQANNIAGGAGAAANSAASTNVWNGLPSYNGSQGISQYESPYTNSVVNATQAQFNNQNAQQQQGIVGNAISSGAWGGDRASVAQGIAAGQQQLAQAPVIAGLENQGFQNAQQEFNTQQGLQANLGQQRAGLMANTALGAGQLGTNAAIQGGQLGLSGAQQATAAQQANAWLNSQAGAGMAALGNEAQNTALTGAQAELGVGGLEQNLDQSQLNVPYQQFQQQQAYPFQSTQWLGNLVEGLGGAAGGTSSTSSPGPSAASQGIGGLGAIASIASLFMKHGGAVPGYASGGGIAPPDMSITFIPESRMNTPAAGGGPPKPPEPAKENDDLQQEMTAINSISDLRSKKSGIADGLPSKDAIRDAFSSKFGHDDPSSFAPAQWTDMNGASDASLMGSAFPNGFAHGGGIAAHAKDSDADPTFSASHIGGSGVSIPQLATNGPKPSGIAANLTKDYGNAAADDKGNSTLKSTTYYPPVDPWWSNNPSNRVPDTSKNALPGATVINPKLKNPTNLDDLTGTGGINGLDLSGLAGLGLKRGGGIQHFDDGGDVDDLPPGSDIESAFADKFDDPFSSGISLTHVKQSPHETGKMQQVRGAAGSTRPAILQDMPSQIPTGLAEGASGDAISKNSRTQRSLPEVPSSHSSGIAKAPAPFQSHPIEAEPPGADVDGDATGENPYKSTYKPRQFTDTTSADESKAKKLALLSASLGMMAGHSPHAMENIGAGGLQGVKTYEDLTKQSQDRKEKQAEQADEDAYRSSNSTQAAQKLWDEAINRRQTRADYEKHMTGQESLERDKLAEEKQFHAGELANQSNEWEYVGPSLDDPKKGVYINKKDGTTRDGPGAGSKTGAMFDQDYVTERANAIANYKEKPMSAFERKTPAGIAIEKAIHAANPDYSETYFPAAVTARTKFASGPQGNTVKSFNVSLSHLATLDALRDALDAGNFKLANEVKQKLSEEFGGTAITDYDTAHRIVMDEATKAVIGSAGGQGDREGYAKTAAAAQSNKQGHDAANIMRGLMVGQLKGLETQYKFGTRANDFEDMLDDDAKSLLHNKKFQPGKNPNAKDADGDVAELPVKDGKVDASAIKPDVKYRTKNGNMTGADLLKPPAQP